ncbi:MAG TPA: hypothetical protein VJZ69_02130 [Clostridia bacterium]|nr:hypothetical protein [Clostridia bacterium]
MKKIMSYILIIAMLSVFLFSMSACNNDKVESGKMNDLIGNKTIERIDYFLKDSNRASGIEASNEDCEAPERMKTWYFDELYSSGKIYSIAKADFGFETIKYAYLDIEYYIEPSLRSSLSNYIILFFSDGTYSAWNCWDTFWYVDVDGKSVKRLDFLWVDDQPIKVVELLMTGWVTGISYDSFKDYWATIESNQFWIEE